MHAYTILLIGAWVLGSGLVAYVCDNLGRKLGKKRLTLWGLRPRHTAMLFTVLTGIGIAGVTVGLVALMVPDAKVALFQVKRINEQLKTLSRTQETLEERNRALQAHNRKLESVALASETRAQESEGRANQARKEMRQVEGQRDRVQRAFHTTQSRLVRLRTSRDRLARQVSERQRRLSSLVSLLEGSQKKLAQAREATDAARNDQTRARNEASRAKKQVAALQKQVTEETRKLEDLSDSLRRITKELDRTQQDLDARRKEITAVSTGYVMNNIVFRNKPVLYTTDQEIARRVIYNTKDQQEVNLQIVKLLEAADEQAREMGAEPLNAGHRAVELIPFSYVDENNETRTWAESEQILKLSQEFVKNNKDIVIRVVATANIFEGEPVKATLKVTPNTLVFKRGDVITKDFIDGRMKESEILKSLIEILQTRVRHQAIRQGMIPSPTGTMGDINWDHMLEAVHNIRSTQKMTEIQIVSFTDAWTADPLTVRFILPS